MAGESESNTHSQPSTSSTTASPALRASGYNASFPSQQTVTSTTTGPSRPMQQGSTSGSRRVLSNTILVNPNQSKNLMLHHIRNVPWETDSSVKIDYVVGETTGVLYLSLRYHRLHPNYIYDRMAKLTHMYLLKVLLILVDVENYHDALRELNRTAILNNYTLILAWTQEEAGRYLETFKAFEHKPPDMIKERVTDDYYAKMTDCLTNIKSVNKTDVLTLLSNFGSLKGVAQASSEELTMCPGFGEQKVRRLQQAFSQPFIIHDCK